MALTAYPTVKFNAGSGSDSAASGAGPATAITCLVNGATSASTTIVVDNASASLSGVAQDGSAVLWVNGIGFVRISTVTDSGGGNWTLVVETALTIGDNVSCAIGGKRATLDATESRRLFAATSSPTASGASGRWTIEFEDDQTITSVVPVAFTRASYRGYVVIRGDSPTTRRTITQSGNAYHFEGTTACSHCRWQNLHFRNSNATKNYVFHFNETSDQTFENCIAGHSDGTDCPFGFGNFQGSGGFITLWNCSILRCTGVGFKDATNYLVYGSEISRCGGAGTDLGGLGSFINSVVSHNGGDGIGSYYCPPVVIGCTIHGNTGDGIQTESNVPYIGRIFNNNITANGGYGVRFNDATYDIENLLEYNNFGTGSLANTSGQVYPTTFSVPSSNLAVDPGYVDASSGVRNFSVGNSAKAQGTPDADANVAAGQTGGKSFVDIGAFQRPERAGAARTLCRGLA